MTAPLDNRPASKPAWAPGLRASALAIGVGAMLLAWPAGAARSQEDPVIAKVDGVEIRQSDLTLADEDVG